jgi:hypothetical protein
MKRKISIKVTVTPHPYSNSMGIKWNIDCEEDITINAIIDIILSLKYRIKCKVREYCESNNIQMDEYCRNTALSDFIKSYQKRA